MSVAARLKSYWNELRECNDALDGLEKIVRKQLHPPAPEGRRTFFAATKRFDFQHNEYTPQTLSLVHSAGSVTRVTRLTYQVDFYGNAAGALSTPFFTLSNYRANPRMLGTIGSTWAATFSDTFDFEWNYTIGSTQKSYAQNRGADNAIFLARDSLGMPGNDRQLLFSEKNPLVLDTNEFLEITVRPIWNYISVSQFDSDAPAILNYPSHIAVSISYAGYRTFGYES